MNDERTPSFVRGVEATYDRVVRRVDLASGPPARILSFGPTRSIRSVAAAPRTRARRIAGRVNGPVPAGEDDMSRDRGASILPAGLLLGGGGTVSRLEWTGNTSGVRFVRRKRRLEEIRGVSSVELFESRLGKKAPAGIAGTFRQRFDENDVVSSGLDDSMHRAHEETHGAPETREEAPDLRPAA